MYIMKLVKVQFMLKLYWTTIHCVGVSLDTACVLFPNVSKSISWLKNGFIEMWFVLKKSWAEKEEESRPQEGADVEGAAEEKAEEAGEGSTWAYPHRGLHHSDQMLGRNKVQLISLSFLSVIYNWSACRHSNSIRTLANVCLTLFLIATHFKCFYV